MVIDGADFLAMSSAATPSDRRPSFFKAFLPFWIVAIVGLLVMAYRYHVGHPPSLTARVTIEGKPTDAPVTFEVNGKAVPADSRVGLGSADIWVHAPGTTTNSQKRFVWYSANDLGAIDLKRLTGWVSIEARPTPDSIDVAGPYAKKTVRAGTVEELPVGDYDVVLHYGNHSEGGKFRISEFQTNRLSLRANFGFLRLTSEPPDAEFELQLKSSGQTSTGKFPSLLGYLSPGDYHLISHRGRYQLEQDIVVRAAETNEAAVKFRYGKLTVTSEPPGASVWVSGTLIGTTPRTVAEVIPGKYAVRLQKDGFDVRDIEVAVDGESEAKAAVALVNTKYRVSMEAAKQDQQAGRFRSALRNLQEALAAQPGDLAVKAQLPTIQSAAYREQAEELANQNDLAGALKTLAEARKLLPDDKEIEAMEATLSQRKRAGDAATAAQQNAQALADQKRRAIQGFEQSLKDEPSASLFPNMLWHTSKSIDEVFSALERVGAAKSDWKITKVSVRNSNELGVKLGALWKLFDWGSYGRLHAFVIAPGETEIHVKLFGFAPGNNGPEPITDLGVIRNTFSQLKGLLSKELGGDLK